MFIGQMDKVILAIVIVVVLLIVYYYHSRESRIEGFGLAGYYSKIVGKNPVGPTIEYPITQYWEEIYQANKEETEWYYNNNAFYRMQVNLLPYNVGSFSEKVAANNANINALRDSLRNMNSLPYYLAKSIRLADFIVAAASLGLSPMLLTLDLIRWGVGKEWISSEIAMFKYPLVYEHLRKTNVKYWHQGPIRTKVAAKLLEVFDQEVSKIRIGLNFNPIRIRATVYRKNPNVIEITRNAERITEINYN